MACRQLGLQGPGVAVARAYYGTGAGPIWLDDVQCQGYETNLDSCKHAAWGTHNW